MNYDYVIEIVCKISQQLLQTYWKLAGCIHLDFTVRMIETELKLKMFLLRSEVKDVNSILALTPRFL